jgi:regulatory protein
VRVRAGEVTWTVGAADAAALGVARGTLVDDALRAALERAADAEAALRTALRSIGRRSFARGDLGRRLVRKGHPAAAVDAALEKCAEMGLLDDAAFARHFVETRAQRGRGPVRLRRDLTAMGVARDVVDAALAGAAGDGEAQAASALALAQRRIGQLQGLPALTQKRRLAAYLARRGFGGEAARKAIGQVVG